MTDKKVDSIVIPKWFIRFLTATGTLLIGVVVAALPWAYGVKHDVSNMSDSISEMREDMKEKSVRERDDLIRITRLEEKVYHLEEKDK